ncbi:MAG: metallophosphoesterase [Polaromonas sp.]|uniref:metallophosphoesterase family protein n=1 Tax=Polaromonas sp. TaxID=1869339 RepID=UPI0025CF07A7|nr:metallophosphoesterase [Polaromonas sp.]MBI2724826.1 metallophosphoesterase [Polaromonas sp.]
MRTIAHLSDLHFGRVDAALLDPLTEFLHAARPHVLVVSGDLTQRAKSKEFIAARAFLDAFDMPKIVVPGNHDVPLYHVFRRFFSPLGRYHEHITTDMEPFYVDDEIAVMGINSARSLTFKGGRVNREQLERVRARLDPLHDRLVKVLVTHHPFDLPAHMDKDDLVGRARKAMKEFANSGVDVLLGGHMHTSEAITTDARYQHGAYSALSIQAGTATSTRQRGEVNSFNMLRVACDRVEVDEIGWAAEEGIFRKTGMQAFTGTKDGWVPAGSRDAPPAQPPVQSPVQ